MIADSNEPNSNSSSIYELNHPVFIRVCPSNDSGEFTRNCSVEGTNWLLPVDSCVQDRLKTIKEQVK